VLKAETQLKTTQATGNRYPRAASPARTCYCNAHRKACIHSLNTIFTLSSIPPPIPAGIPSDLLERRPDIAGAERRNGCSQCSNRCREGGLLSSHNTGLDQAEFDAATLSKWLIWPSRFWSIGETAAQTILDFGLRGAQTDQAIAAYDASVATYRQSVLTGFQEVEDNLAALRILEEEAAMQDEAVNASRQSVAISTNQYKAGIVSYLDVVTVMTIQI